MIVKQIISFFFYHLLLTKNVKVLLKHGYLEQFVNVLHRFEASLSSFSLSFLRLSLFGILFIDLARLSINLLIRQQVRNKVIFFHYVLAAL